MLSIRILAGDLSVTRWALELVLFTVATWEALLGAFLITCARFSRWPSVAAAVTLTGMTFVLVYFFAMKDAPRCGCFGGSRLLRSARAEHAVGIARNLGMLWLLAAAMRSRTQTLRSAS